MNYAVQLNELPSLVREFASYKAVVQNASEKTISEYLLDLRTFFRFMLARDQKINPLSEDFEKIDVIYVTSWLLDPQIKTLMGKETNLTKFIDRFFCLAPFQSDATALFPYVFGVKDIPPYEELPETSSFAKAVKDHLISGGNIYGAFGIIL